MSYSDDLIKRVEGENYKKAVKHFEVVRVVIKGTLAPLLGRSFITSNYKSLSKACSWTDSAN